VNAKVSGEARAPSPWCGAGGERRAGSQAAARSSVTTANNIRRSASSRGSSFVAVDRDSVLSARLETQKQDRHTVGGDAVPE
jgi:hypothetical protein